jgi:hypothetical protein
VSTFAARFSTLRGEALSGNAIGVKGAAAPARFSACHMNAAKAN